jgi:DNA-binding SARP family transcriptional activator
MIRPVIEQRRRLAETVREAIAWAETARADRPLRYLQAASKALHEAAGATPVLLDLISGRVFGPDGPVALAPAELAVVMLLAVHEHGLSREELADILYPDADEVKGPNAVKVAVHRARRRIAVPDAIRCRSARYGLGAAINVELRRIEGEFRRLRTMPALDGPARDLLKALQRRLKESRPAFVERWSWFEPTERRLRDLYRNVTIVLARDAMRVGRLERVIELTIELTEADPLDEEAAELGIRALLRLGDRSSALLAYRRYAAHVTHELNLPPPRAMSALFS